MIHITEDIDRFSNQGFYHDLELEYKITEAWEM